MHLQHPVSEVRLMMLPVLEKETDSQFQLSLLTATLLWPYSRHLARTSMCTIVERISHIVDPSYSLMGTEFAS